MAANYNKSISALMDLTVLLRGNLYPFSASFIRTLAIKLERKIPMLGTEVLSILIGHSFDFLKAFFDFFVELPKYYLILCEASF